MARLKIKFVYNYSAAFTINNELYYIKTGPQLPKLFDNTMKKLIIPNIDHWLQAQTQQRYSYNGLKDMIEAFQDGLEHSYAKDDLMSLCSHVFDVTRDYIFKTEYARSYAFAYKVELMDNKNITKLIEQIKNNFDSYLEKFGEERFYKYLCRILQICNYYEPSDSSIIETLIKRLGKQVQEPDYPIPEKEYEVKSKVVHKILGSDLAKYKGIDEYIVTNVNNIEHGILR